MYVKKRKKEKSHTKRKKIKIKSTLIVQVIKWFITNNIEC